MSDSIPCVPVAPSTNTGYTVSLAVLLAVTVRYVVPLSADAGRGVSGDEPEGREEFPGGVAGGAAGGGQAEEAKLKEYDVYSCSKNLIMKGKNALPMKKV